MRLGFDEFKEFCKDFPTQGGSAVVALALIALTGVIVAFRLALGVDFPDGYDAWLIFLGTLAGVATGGMIGKRATDFRHKNGDKEPPPTSEVRP